MSLGTEEKNVLSGWEQKRSRNETECNDSSGNSDISHIGKSHMPTKSISEYAYR